ncbi:protein SON-like [Limulus polyphemus]|uniref:Protein SON-like n=1 Tax=Limulus polyphemus TaxID=6850 RepID=A0ABM1TM42_LIMPO|nr:protein SON-like [Limulus polyphemus]
MHLLKKMGWNPGEGLGKNKEGSLEPLLLNVKTDKKGLVAGSEMKKKPIFTAIAKDFSGKHPVSAIMELCTKRRWDPPQFSLVDENGPSHKKTFLFKVRVNGIEYQPAVSSPSKKQAKAVTATVCLQALGILPRDLDNSL